MPNLSHDRLNLFGQLQLSCPGPQPIMLSDISSRTQTIPKPKVNRTRYQPSATSISVGVNLFEIPFTEKSQFFHRVSSVLCLAKVLQKIEFSLNSRAAHLSFFWWGHHQNYFMQKSCYFMQKSCEFLALEIFYTPPRTFALGLELSYYRRFLSHF